MMSGETPGFWWTEPSWQAALLSPAALAYGAAARWRLEHGERADAGLPVLCVGNFTVGGGGKTPTALALGRAAIAMGLKPGFLSRGHGGALTGPVLVDRDHHHAGAVGDEPMLLARLAPTAIAVDRKRGAALLKHDAGCDLVIMDDGFQSARLVIDHAVLVIDAGRGLGNGRVVPAGPLRAPLRDQIRCADALLVVGRGSAGDDAIRRTAKGGKPVFEARLAPKDGERLVGKRLMAFAGIADPGKFYRTLADIGADIVLTRDFPDHHRFSREDLAELRDTADRDGLALATTEKDAVRLEQGHAEARAFLERIEVLAVDLVFEPASVASRFIRETMSAYRRRTVR